MRVKLFLDVDGVLAPLPNRSPYWGDWQNIGRGGGPTPIVGFDQLWLSRRLGDALWDLTYIDNLEVIWLTTWGQLANEVLCPYFDWPDLEVLTDEDDCDPKGRYDSLQAYYSAMTRWWKLEQIRQQTTPFIWIDDDIDLYLSAHPGALKFLKGYMTSPPLIISPEKSEGLTPNHIDLMRQFVDGDRSVAREN